MVAWLAPSDNLLLVRQKAYIAAGSMFSEQDKPRQIRRAEDQQQRSAELAAIAAWARGDQDAFCQSRPCRPHPSAMFVTDHEEFRLYSRRPIVAVADDVRIVYYLTPRQIESWMHRFVLQERILHGNVDDDSLRQFIQELSLQEEMRRAGQWYLIMETSISTDESKALEPVTSDRWGRYFRVFRLDGSRLAAVGSSPAAR
jgi:hypothetical protein